MIVVTKGGCLLLDVPNKTLWACSSGARIMRGIILVLLFSSCSAWLTPTRRPLVLRPCRLAGAMSDGDGPVAEAADSIGQVDPEMSSCDRMKEKLRAESKYPLKAPLLAGSAILGGKGLTDALITVIKVSTGFKGASLSETFFGVPVLAIDGACIASGIAIGVWTWQTQRDDEPS